MCRGWRLALPAPLAGLLERQRPIGHRAIGLAELVAAGAGAHDRNPHLGRS